MRRCVVTRTPGCVTILCADDDPDDRMLLGDALDEVGFDYDLRFAEDGEQLLAYLQGRGGRPTRAVACSGPVLFLDSQHAEGGRARGADAYPGRPTSSRHPDRRDVDGRLAEDIEMAYSSGASWFVVKPASFDQLVRVMEVLVDHRTDVGELPGRHRW